MSSTQANGKEPTMKRLVTVAFCFVLFLVGITILVSPYSTPAHAQETCAVPKAFGTLRGGGGMPGLIFEAPNGTIRLVTFECAVEATIPRR
jgi:hypothetical protein